MTSKAKKIDDDAALTNVHLRQAPLREIYARTPCEALISYRARSSSAHVPATDPLATSVECGDTQPHLLSVGVHRAFGGECRLPAPGDLFAAAIAAGLDTAIRMNANLMAIELTWLEVEVKADVDARGTLQMDRDVPISFQAIEVFVSIAADASTTDRQVSSLLRKAEACSAILQALQNPARIVVTRILR